MQSTRRSYGILVALLALMMVLAACGGGGQPAAATTAPTTAPAPTQAPAEEPEEEPTEVASAEPTEAPEEEPTEAAVEEPTEAPEEEPTEAPEEEPTEAPEEEPTEAPEEEPTEPAEEEETPEPEATEPAEEEETPEAEATEEGAPDDGEESAADPGVFELTEFNSYRSRTAFGVEGEAFEDEEFSQLEILGEYVKEPPAQHITIGVGEGQTIEVIQIEDQSWVNFGGTWVESTGEDISNFTTGLMLFDLSQVTENLDQLEEVGAEEVNGVETTHYTIDDPEVLFGLLEEEPTAEDLEGVEAAQGDFWIAEEGFIVRATMHMEGTGINDNAPDASGSVDIEHELTDFDADIEITPPDTGASGAAINLEELLGADVPLPEGATATLTTEGLAVYDIPGLTVAEAAEFFRTNLTDLGFVLDEDASFEGDTAATLTFTSEDLQLQLDVTIGESDTGDGVSVTLSSSQLEE